MDRSLVQGLAVGGRHARSIARTNPPIPGDGAVKCRFCGAAVTTTFVDLGMQPLSNAYVADADSMEPFYPLHARVCGACLLVQVPEFQPPERIFSDYSYLSSMSDSWLAHCGRYAKDLGIPVLGIEPAANVAAIAERAGIRSIPRFFGTELASELVAKGTRADLLVGNNVLAHVPNLNDFVRGLAMLLADEGVLTMEFPHLGKLIAHNQFDTIYHEHFSYFSLGTAAQVFAAHGLRIFDVDELSTHGGSLRVYACHEARE